jgi:omega-6 fatty acid desaturase (delta-12 desaturase)
MAAAATTSAVPAPRAPWKAAVAPYAQPRAWRTWLDIATAVVPYFGLLVAMYFVSQSSTLLTLALAVPTGGFLLRTFVLFHDCTHGSLMATKRGNRWMGTFLGLLVYTPFESWRHSHHMHHATAGDLDRRGAGDVTTLTVAEYNARSPRARLAYRLFRNPLVMFGLGPIWALVINPRLVRKGMRPRLRRSVLLTNVAVVAMVGGLCWLMGWQEYLLVQGPAAWMAGSAGVFLFYVQHQFEDVYWENTDSWNYADAALQGSSYLKLPKVLQFFTGNIGLHHVHHLSARIPNYNLQRAHDANPVFHGVPQISLSDGVRASRLKLYDEERGRLVTWSEARVPASARRDAAEVVASPSAV